MFNGKKVLVMMMTLVLVMSTILPAMSFAEEAVTIDIYSFNDFHGALIESGKNVGMAKLVGAVNALKAVNPNTIVVSAGDNYQGSAMSNLSYGEPVSEMFKLLGVTVSAVGNHEFDWGTDKITKWTEDGDLTFLASNIYDKTTGEPVAWAKPYVIKEQDGKKIAFIGLTTEETAYKTKAENVATLEFKDPAEAAKIWVDYLMAGKDASGKPDAIIALTHIPASQNGYGADIAEPVTGDEIASITAVEGIDGVVCAHNHATVAGYSNGVPVVEAYYSGRALGHLSLSFTGSTLKVTPSVDNLYKRSEEITPDPAALAAFEKWNKDLAPTLNEVLGKADGTFSHDRYTGASTTVLGRWVCETMAKAAGTQIAIQNGGGLRRDIPAGDITYGILYEVMPFDNTLVTLKLSGADLLKNIEHGIANTEIGNASFSGLQVDYDSALEAGSRVLGLRLADGTPVAMDQYYTVVINDFMYPKGDNFDFTGAIDVKDTFIPIRDVLVNEIKSAGTIKALPADYAKAYGAYTVKGGDVLWKIAKKLGTTYQNLGKVNGLKNVNLIYEGQTLLVPQK